MCIPALSYDVWVIAQYVYMHIQRVDGYMLIMFACTFRDLMDECSLCIYAHSEGW